MKIIYNFLRVLILLLITNIGFAACPPGDPDGNLYFATSANGPYDSGQPLGSMLNPITDFNSSNGLIDALNDCGGNRTAIFLDCYYTNDGDMGDIDAIRIPAVDNVILDGQGAMIEVSGASIRFLTLAGLNNWTIRNFVFKGFNQNVLLLTDMTNTVIENCVFDSNPTQRAVRVDTEDGSGMGGSDVTFNSCVFSNNPPVSETPSTGAVEVREDEFPAGDANNLVVNFNDCDFSCNARQGFGGGALWISPTSFPSNEGPTVNITGGSFVNNFSGTDTGDGGAIGINGEDSFLNIDGTLFSCNHSEASTGDGGGGAIRIAGGPTVDITNATFYGNFSSNSAGSIPAGGYGGAININSTSNVSTLTVSNSVFTDNQSSRGGAFYLESGNVTFDNVLITGNTAATDAGGGVNNAGANFTIMNTSITANSPDDISGAVTDNGGTATTTDPEITECAACAPVQLAPTGCEADAGMPAIADCVVLCATPAGGGGGAATATTGQAFDLSLTFSPPTCGAPTDFTYLWLVVNDTGVIQNVVSATDTNADGIPDAAAGTPESFDFASLGIAPGEYNIYGYHYETATGSNPTVGSNISALDTVGSGINTAACDALSTASPNITVLNPVLISITTSCTGAAAGEFNSTLTITGGYPEFNGSGNYTFTTNTPEFTSPYTFGTAQTQGITFSSGSTIDVTVSSDGNMTANADCTSCDSSLEQEAHLECSSCPATQDFSVASTTCSGSAIDWTSGASCSGVDGPATPGGGLVVDLYIYSPGGTASEAPVGFETSIDVSAPTEFVGRDNSITINNPDISNVGGDYTCANPPSATVLTNETCSPITVTYFTIVFNWSLDTDGDLVYEYEPDCSVERHDVTIYPAALSTTVVDNGSSCGTPVVELRAVDGSVCSSQSGIGTGSTATGACANDGDVLNFDFTNDPIITALSAAPASCAPSNLTGTVTCSTCSGSPSISIVKDDNDNNDDTQAVSPGGTATFSIVVTNTGDVNLENVTVTDAMTPDCDNTIGNLAVGESISYTCSLTGVSAAFTNTANVTGDPVGGGTAVTDTDDSEVTLNSPSISIVKDDNDNNDDTQAVSPGGTATFSIVVTNTGNVDLENVTVTDAMTPDCDNTIGDLVVGESISYTCSLTGVSAAFTNTANVTGDPVGGGTAVTDTDDSDVTLNSPSISIVKDDNDNNDDTQAVSPGGTAIFSIVVTNTGDVDLENVTVSDVMTPSCDNTIGNLAVGESISYTCSLTGVSAAFTNTANVTGDPVGGGTAVTDTDDSEVTLNSPSISIVKDDNDNNDDTQAVSPGGTATFSIVVTNNGNVDLENVTVSDAMTPSCDNTIGNLAVGESISYTCVSTAVSAAFTNTANVTGDPVGGGTAVTDTDDSEVTLNSPSISIVKDDNDNNDDTQAVSPDGTATFSIVVTNTGNVDLENVTVSDAMTPSCDNTIGNLGVGESISYTCSLTGVSAAFTNTANVTGDPVGGGTAVTDIDDSEVTLNSPSISIVKDDNDNNDDTQAVSPGGTATFSIVVTNTGNVDLENVTVSDAMTPSCDNTIGNLGVGESISYTCSLTGVSAAFTNTANVTGDPVGGGTAVTDTDDSEVTLNSPSISIVKDDNDNNDDTQAVSPGGTATFSIVVTNTGDIDLENVTVTDAMTPDCDNTIGDLAVGESISYTCVSTAVSAAFTNTANVTGDSVGGGTAVTDTDNSDVTLAAPSISIVKDDNDNNDDTQAVSSGGTATFSIVVTNTGNVDLENVTVSDAMTPSCDNTIGALAVGASISYTCVSTAVSAAFTNTANVTGDPVGGGTAVTDTDDSEVTLNSPSISIVKDDNDNNDDTQAVSPGGTATFSIVVTNTGDVDLENVTVSDTMTPSCDNTIGDLAIGESISYTCVSTAVSAAFTNTANVTGDPVDGGTAVTDTDDSDVTLNSPSISIVKDDNDNNDDTQAVSPGGTATFSIVVTNTGNVDLENVTVIDAMTPSCDNTIGTLAVGASISYTCVSTAVSAAFTNTANVTGDPVGGGTAVTDTDDSEVTLNSPSISIVKDDNDNNDDTQAVSPGGTATFSIVVTNTGDVDLENVTVSDAMTPDCDNTIGNLAVGESISYTCSLTGVSAAFTNTANVTGDPVGGGTAVTDTDDSNVTIGNPSISILKTAADGTDTQNVLEGETATFEITVTNTGDMDLTDVEVVDALSPNCNSVIGNLNVGESTTYTCTIENVLASFENIAVVSGNPTDGGTPVTDEDESEVKVPAITIVKTAVDGSDSQIINTNGTANFEITVTNTGDVDLENVTVTDALSPNCDNIIGNLAIGEVAAYTCTLEAVTESFVNIASVTGDPVGGGNSVTDEDDSEVLIQDPELVITKSNEPSGLVCQGAIITYTLEVANIATGINAGVATNVVITDMAPANTTFVSSSTMYVSGIAPVNNNPATPEWTIAALQPGESTTVSFDVMVDNTAENGDLILNVATVNADEIPAAIESNEVENEVGGPVVVCRQPISTTSLAGECGNSSITMLPPFVESDNCGITEITNDAPTIFDLGATLVTWTITLETGASTTCEQEVIVEDATNPSVQYCNTSIDWAYEGCLAEVTIDVGADDDCGIASIEGNGVFNLTLGIHPHPVTITDNNGNQTIHMVTIYVHDDIAPEALNCPESFTINSTEAEDFIAPEPQFFDNCEVISVTSDAPETYPIGTTTVSWTASDTYGLYGYCSYDVIVEPVIAIGGLQDIETCVEDDAARAAVRWNLPQVTTLCTACPTTEYTDFTHLGDFYGNQYFVYTGEAMSWENAAEMAQIIEGGHLVTVNNRAENNFLRYVLPNEVNDVWLGLEVTEVEGVFDYNWADNTASNYQNFGDVIDYTATENVLTLQNTGAWTFTDKTELRGFIVERSCMTVEQTGPYLETVDETGDTLQTLLTIGSEWETGEYTVAYRAYDDCGNETTSTFEVNVAEPQAEYCATGGHDASVWIQQLTVKDQRRGENQTGGYFDNTENAVVFDAEDNMIRFEMVSGGNTTGQDLFWSIWLDKNDDGDFFDTDELIHSQINHEAVVEAFIPIMQFSNEARRMRVAVSRYDYPEVCADYFSGEAEDYLLSYDGTPNFNINFENGTLNGSEDLSENNVIITPNPAVDYTNIALPAVEMKTTLTVLNTIGQVIKTIAITPGTSSYRLLTKDLTNGFYVLNFNNGGDITVTKKLMIQR